MPSCDNLMGHLCEKYEASKSPFPVILIVLAAQLPAGSVNHVMWGAKRFRNPEGQCISFQLRYTFKKSQYAKNIHISLHTGPSTSNPTPVMFRFTGNCLNLRTTFLFLSEWIFLETGAGPRIFQNAEEHIQWKRPNTYETIQNSLNTWPQLICKTS